VLFRVNRYKERVRSAISQKRSTAEKNRLSLLEAEKRRAHARVMRARRIAKAVCSQRETERLRMEQQLKDKLQRVYFCSFSCCKLSHTKKKLSVFLTQMMAFQI
jgi:regulator of replication initiation timing